MVGFNVVALRTKKSRVYCGEPRLDAFILGLDGGVRHANNKVGARNVPPDWSGEARASEREDYARQVPITVSSVRESLPSTPWN